MVNVPPLHVDRSDAVLVWRVWMLCLPWAQLCGRSQHRIAHAGNGGLLHGLARHVVRMRTLGVCTYDTKSHVRP